jgi:hypothetical protein
VKILSIGDQVVPGTYAVKTRFERSVLLFHDSGDALFVVDRSLGPGPLNLVVADPNAFLPGDTLEIPRRKDAARFDSTMPKLDRDNRTRLLALLETALPRHAPRDSLISLFAPPNKIPRLQQARDDLFRKAFAHFAAQRMAEGVRLIRGCGAGLTPAGDDFLCGLMLACRLRPNWAMAQTILRHALGQNPVSNAFLKMAAKGCVPIDLQLLLRSPSDAGVKKVCAFGHSSGADLLCGLRYGLKPRGG